MRYTDIVPAVFIRRPNRFIAEVELDGRIETVHVKNTGRCHELLTKGARVWLERSHNPARKTAFDLVTVEKIRSGMPPLLVNMDSQMPNHAAEEWLRKGDLFPEGSVIKRESVWGNSRFDFRIEHEGNTSFLEVKGVTLEGSGIVSFPDAPTERGVKHINELIECRKQGLGAWLLFVVQMKGPVLFRPNDKTHREFGDTLRKAVSMGVNCIAADCIVTPDSVEIDQLMPIDLSINI